MDFGQVLEGLAHKIAENAGIDPATIPPFATETTEEASTMQRKIEPLDTIMNFRGMMETIVESVIGANPSADHEVLCEKLIRQVRWHGLGDETCCPWEEEPEIPAGEPEGDIGFESVERVLRAAVAEVVILRTWPKEAVRLY